MVKVENVLVLFNKRWRDESAAAAAAAGRRGDTPSHGTAWRGVGPGASPGGVSPGGEGRGVGRGPGGGVGVPCSPGRRGAEEEDRPVRRGTSAAAARDRRARAGTAAAMYGSPHFRGQRAQ